MRKTRSETDWDRVLAFKEGERIPYEPGDDPNDTEAAREFFERADLIRKGKVVRRGKRGPQKAPTKKLVSLRLSSEVVEHFRSTGPGWQTRIDETQVKAIRKRAWTQWSR
ncbi:MAG TPA: BrnA antitoxin family protein [Terracidiphilus sp.]|nr:BrnA antitoxin family protein [Terracidiphilus sp.]